MAHYLTCKACGATVLYDARFCANCGQVLKREEPQKQDTDKRILTLLFADLAGSTALAEASGLEGYDAVMQKFHTRAADIISAYGGVVVQSYGDGVFATFGLRKDGEDAALAALAAGLAMTRDMPKALSGNQLRVGIHTGRVICRLGNAGEYMPQVTGFDVNLTARIQENAAIGSVNVSTATHDFLQRLATLTVERQNTVELKGVSGAINVYQIKDYTFDHRGAHLDSVLERQEPLDEIMQTAGHALVFGPAGIGKSTFLESIVQAAPPDRPLIIFSARSNLTRSSFVPVLNWIKSEMSDSTFAATVARLQINLADKDTDYIQSLLSPAIALPDAAEMAPAQLRTRQILAMTAMLAELLSRGTWLLFDDFHWTDDNTRDVIAALVARQDIDHSKILLFARPFPEVMAFADTAKLPQIELLPLSKEASVRVLSSTTARNMSQAQRTDIINKAVGNPLYLISLAASTPSDASFLPATMTASIQAFINQFDGLKPLISAAAVIGRVFTIPHLKLLITDHPAMADELSYLELRGLLRMETDSISFAHPLYRETAYDMMTDTYRRATHAKFARQVMAHDPEFCQTYPELMADHAIASNEIGLIVPHCLTAGAAFLKRANFDLAIQYFTAAVTALRRDSGKIVSNRTAYLTALSYLASSQVQKYGFAHDIVLQSYQTLDDESLQSGSDDMTLMMALYGLFAHRMVSGHVNECRPLLDRMTQAQNTDVSATSVLKLVNDCAYGLYAGDFVYADKSADALHTAYDVTQHGQIFLDIAADPLLSVLSAQTLMAFARGAHDAGRNYMSDALAHLDEIGAEIQRPWLEIFGSAGLFFAGFQDEAMAKLDEGIALADHQGAAFWQLNGRLWQSSFLALGDQPDVGREGLDSLIPTAKGAGIGLCLPAFEAAQAHACHALGDMDAARTAAGFAATQVERYKEGLFAPLVYETQAKLAQSADEKAAALARAKHYRRLSGIPV